MEPNERLKRARLDAGYKSPRAAADRFGWNVVTVRAHENGGRGLTRENTPPYARAYRVTVGYLLNGEKLPVHVSSQTPIVGYVGAGAEAHFYAEGQGTGDFAMLPVNATDDTVALEARGDSLGPFFNRWIVYYDERRDPPTEDMIGKLCVVETADGKVLVKRLMRGSLPGTFHLLSQMGEPLEDQELVWAARVTSMAPRA